jgi:hypothetical protein
MTWAVLAPISPDAWREIVAREFRRGAPYAIDPPPYELVAGRGYTALISREPGTESADWRFAEIASRTVPHESVYSMWLNPEKLDVLDWRNGAQVGEHAEDPLELAERLGFQVTPLAQPTVSRSVAVVEDASMEDVRQALGAFKDEPWLRTSLCNVGVLISSADGSIGLVAWDVSERLPATNVYLAQHWQDTGNFEVAVVRGGEMVGRFAHPALAGQPITDIRGQRTPESVLQAMDVPPELLGFSPG